MAGKQYEVTRYFRRTDPHTGIDTHYQVEDSYSGPIDDGYLDPKGPDGHGPLIVDKVEKAAADKAAAEQAAADKAAEEKAAEEDSKAAADKAAAATKAAAEKAAADKSASDSSNKEK